MSLSTCKRFVLLLLFPASFLLSCHVTMIRASKRVQSDLIFHCWLCLRYSSFLALSKELLHLFFSFATHPTSNPHFKTCHTWLIVISVLWLLQTLQLFGVRHSLARFLLRCSGCGCCCLWTTIWLTATCCRTCNANQSCFLYYQSTWLVAWLSYNISVVQGRLSPLDTGQAPQWASAIQRTDLVSWRQDQSVTWYQQFLLRTICATHNVFSLKWKS